MEFQRDSRAGFKRCRLVGGIIFDKCFLPQNRDCRRPPQAPPSKCENIYPAAGACGARRRVAVPAGTYQQVHPALGVYLLVRTSRYTPLWGWCLAPCNSNELQGCAEKVQSKYTLAKRLRKIG